MRASVTVAAPMFGWCVLFGSTTALSASCETYDFAGPYAEAFLAGNVFDQAADAAREITSMADGECQQDALDAILEPALGPVVGYKAAATSAAAQEQLGLNGPVLGLLFRDQLLGDGATVTIDDGARLIVELDLLARVGPEGFEGVTDRTSALAAIDAFVPFIELGDLMTPAGVPVTGPLLQAMNAGSRFGVAGTPVPRWDMTEDDVEVIAGTLALNGTVVAEAPATALLGHPLDAVLWIATAAKARGMALKPGDLLSLGSMGRFQPAVPGEVVATYSGLGLEPVSVHATLK